jgi:hypothetical protein
MFGKICFAIFVVIGTNSPCASAGDCERLLHIATPNLMVLDNDNWHKTFAILKLDQRHLQDILSIHSFVIEAYQARLEGVNLDEIRSVFFTEQSERLAVSFAVISRHLDNVFSNTEVNYMDLIGYKEREILRGIEALASIE